MWCRQQYVDVLIDITVYVYRCSNLHNESYLYTVSLLTITAECDNVYVNLLQIATVASYN